MTNNPAQEPLEGRSTAAPGDPVAAFRVKLNRLQLEHLKEAGLRASHAHSAFLEMRREALHHLALVQEIRAGLAGAGKRPLFDREALVEFATGSMAKCFGPEFRRFDSHRHPRIPNGDLLLMSRIVSIEGKRQAIQQGASITAEYDVPADAWFYTPQAAGLPPYSILMEIALQPCGFLSAFMGTSLLLPTGDYYFRNLDGQAKVLADIDLRGKMVTSQARQLSTTLSGTTIIQKYQYSLSCAGQIFYEGEAVFGYFSYETMVAQVGLDGNRAAQPAGQSKPLMPTQHHGMDENSPLQGAYVPQFNMLDRWNIELHGGSRKQGLVRAEADIQPQDWFYACHFYEDPVMPGSLGIEAMLQAMLLLAIQDRPDLQSKPVRTVSLLDQTVAWKYRGQVLPSNRRLALEVEITHRETRDRETFLLGNGSLWIDGMRIYEVKDLGLSLTGAD